MAQVHVIERDGSQLDATLKPDQSLMEIIRDAGVEDAFALCGGNLSCATCHVFIDPAVIGALAVMSEDESDLLDASAYRRPESRLSCQVPCSNILAERRVEVAPAE